MRRRKPRQELENAPAPLLHSGRIPMASLLQTLAVAEFLNFRHAANALGVSQSHVGMIARGECGRLRVGVQALVPGDLLAELVGRYREQHPTIDLDITEGAARETVALVRAHRLDVAFVANSSDIPDCHSRRIWTEQLVAAAPSNHPLANRAGVVWTDLAPETFLVRHGGTGPQVHDHILLRLTGRFPNPSIIRFEVECATLLSMVAQGFGLTIVGDADALTPRLGVVFLPICDEPEPIAFSAVWSPHNRSPALASLFALAGQMGGLARRLTH